ncbi:MAG: hypothetical protein ABFR65_01610 [Pseudomonadota bacterium]
MNNLTDLTKCQIGNGILNGILSVYVQSGAVAIMIQVNLDDSMQLDVVNLLRCKSNGGMLFALMKTTPYGLIWLAMFGWLGIFILALCQKKPPALYQHSK